MDYARKLLKGKKYSQDNLIPFVVLVIGSFGGIAYKNEVDKKMYKILKEEFSEQIYHETVSHNVPRWMHDIAWAKERAKQIHSYVKSAEDSGRGIWELTEKGKDFYAQLIRQIEQSVRTRKKGN
jgi:hypothetical protein